MCYVSLLLEDASAFLSCGSDGLMAIPSVVMALLKKAYGGERGTATMGRARLRLNLEYKRVTSISGPW